MESFFSEEIDAYVEDHASPVSPLLEELERETYEKTENPQMLTGRVEGRLLQMLLKITGARKVVDIGTFTGYSALMMAEGLPEDGKVITCEISREHAEFAKRYFEKSDHGRKIQVRISPALETLSELPDASVDFVFIDADKPLYKQYYEESLRIVKKGGMIAVDNALWSGRVLSPQDEDSRAIASFNKRVKEDERVEKVLLTVRDGVYLIRKK